LPADISETDTAPPAIEAPELLAEGERMARRADQSTWQWDPNTGRRLWPKLPSAFAFILDYERHDREFSLVQLNAA
jgi:hypothetical protein